MARQREGRHVGDEPAPGASAARSANVLRVEPDTYRAALVRAAVLLGGAVALSRRMQIPMPDLTRWLAGDGRPPMGTFLRVIDVLLEEEKLASELPALDSAGNRPEQNP